MWWRAWPWRSLLPKRLFACQINFVSNIYSRLSAVYPEADAWDDDQQSNWSQYPIAIYESGWVMSDCAWQVPHWLVHDHTAVHCEMDATESAIYKGFNHSWTYHSSKVITELNDIAGCCWFVFEGSKHYPVPSWKTNNTESKFRSQWPSKLGKCNLVRAILVFGASN